MVQIPSESQVESRGWLDRLESRFRRYSSLIAAILLAFGFLWRLWLAHATFFNTDEAWHFFLANQDSAQQAYKASLTISHPPLLILVEYFWRALGTSNLVLRLPAVIAGALSCWIFYRWLNLVAGAATAWAGLILSAFLAPMISTSAEVRQNPLLLMFAVAAIYFFDRALSGGSALAMLASAACLVFAMLSHYSAFFVAAALGVYSILRMWTQPPAKPVIAAWIVGQTSGVTVAAFLYKTHLGRLGSVLKEALPPQQYLASSYFQAGSDHVVPFLYRGTIGVFRFVFGQTQIGQFAVVLFAVGVVLLFLRRGPDRGRDRTLGILLMLPLVLNWFAVAAGAYPFGRMRQCMFLAIFFLAGISVALAWIAHERSIISAVLALAIVLLCHAFGTLQDRDAFPLAEQRHEHMDAAIQFVRSEVLPGDVILTDKATSYQLLHYLCHQKPAASDPPFEGLEVFRCDRFVVLSTGPFEGALSVPTILARWIDARGFPNVTGDVWVVEGGWATGMGEQLRSSPALSQPALAQIDVHSFGRYLEIIKMPPGKRTDVVAQPAR